MLKLAPADEIAKLYLGEIHYAAKQRRAALAYYDKSGQRFAQDPQWTLHYGRCLLDAGRTKAAVSALERIPPSAGAGLFEAGWRSARPAPTARPPRSSAPPARAARTPTRRATTRP